MHRKLCVKKSFGYLVDNGRSFDTNYRKICVTTQVDFGRKYALKLNRVCVMLSVMTAGAMIIDLKP